MRRYITITLVLVLTVFILIFLNYRKYSIISGESTNKYLIKEINYEKSSTTQGDLNNNLIGTSYNNSNSNLSSQQNKSSNSVNSNSNKILSNSVSNKSSSNVSAKPKSNSNNLSSNKKSNTNTNTKPQSNTNTSKNEDTQDDTTPKSRMVGNHLEELEFQYKKYGTKFYTARYYNMKTNPDGTTEKVLSYTITTIDSSGFNANASTMLEDAKKLVKENSKAYNELLVYVNEYRKKVGAKPLTLDYNLSLVATIRAMEMAYTDNMDHIRPNGKNCFSVFDELKMKHPSISGENIAAGYSNPQAVAQGWRESKEGHYENMINPKFTKVGLGMFSLQGTYYNTYWAQMLAG